MGTAVEYRPRILQEIHRPDLPPGPTWQCPKCGTSIRTGMIHLGTGHSVVFIDGKPHYYED